MYAEATYIPRSMDYDLIWLDVLDELSCSYVVKLAAAKWWVQALR